MPHQLSDVLFEGASLENAKKAMILVHGRGATAQSILPLATEMGVNEDFAVIAVQAQGNTWYPYSFVAPEESNQPFLDSALSLLEAVLNKVLEAGIKAENIHFAGFAQGACLVSEFCARNAQAFGSLHVYSGGLIGQQLDESKYSGSFNGMPVLIGCSDIDSHIPLQRVKETTQVLTKLGAKVDERIYPNAPHSVFQDEIGASRAILGVG
jgi:phospholipase/carboxylesterase